MLAIYLAAFVTPVSDLVFDEVARAHARLGAASLTATSNVLGFGSETTTKYEVRYRRPTEYRLRTFAPNGGALVLDVAIGASKVTTYDPTLEQYLVDDRSAGDPLGATVAALHPNLNDLLLSFAEQGATQVWIEDMRKNAAWKFKESRGALALSFETEGTSVTLKVSPTSFLIESIDSATGLDQISWTLRYDKEVRPLKFTPPADAFEVPYFDKEMKPPTYKDDAAKEATARIFDAYSSLSSLGYKVTRSGSVTTIRLRGKFIRQDDDVASWTYDGKTLVAHHKASGKWYRGDVGFVSVIDAVAGLDTRVDPTLRHLMTGFNPYRRRLGDGAEVRIVGQVPVDGEPATMLLAETENAVIRLVVLDSSGLVVRTSIRGSGPDGISTEDVDLAFAYFAVPNDAAARFRLRPPVGTSPAAVSALIRNEELGGDRAVAALLEDPDRLCDSDVLLSEAKVRRDDVGLNADPLDP